MSFTLPSFEPSRDKKSLRRQLQAERQTLIDRHQRAMHLQEVLRVYLLERKDLAVGAYWPIKGEFDALPALYRRASRACSRVSSVPAASTEGPLRGVWACTAVDPSASSAAPVLSRDRHKGGVGRLMRPNLAHRPLARAACGDHPRPAEAGRVRRSSRRSHRA